MDTKIIKAKAEYEKGDYISITGLEIFAHHGVFEEEKRDGQSFYINARLYLDLHTAGKTDDLSKSVNYGEVCHFMTEVFTKECYDLIETAGEKLCEAVLLQFPLIKEIELELQKPHAPIGLPFQNVSVNMCRGWHTAYISFGSNMGDSRALIEEGIESIKAHPHIRNVVISELLVTKPYGGVEQDDFLNGCLKLETLLNPEELLVLLHQIEKRAGRERIIHWGPRTLDMDIVFYDKLVYESEDLIIPHMDMHNRFFVLKPLSELCPNLRHPIMGKTVAQLLRDVQNKDNA